MATNNFIELKNISKSYEIGKDKTLVLDDISIAFKENCFSVIAGPSGSGKSTLLNILGCLDKPDKGAYYLNGRLIDYKHKSKLSGIRKDNFGFVFQSFNLIPVLSAQENVELPLTLFSYSAKEIRERATQMLELVGLASKLKNKPTELSGGEQQRVAIARAMVANPKIIFADEPTANLDRKNTDKVINLMKELNDRNGVSFVFSSHDELVISAAKELYKVMQGKLIEQNVFVA